VSNDQDQRRTNRGELQVGLAVAANIAAVGVPSRPRLAPWLTLIDLGDGRLQLRAADLALTLPEGLFSEAARAICPLLDGTRSVDELAGAGGERFLPGTIMFVLKLLQRWGTLSEGAPFQGLSAETRLRGKAALDLLAHYVADTEQVLHRLSSSQVVLAGSEAVCSRIAAALATVGVVKVSTLGAQIQDGIRDAKDADLLVVASESTGFGLFEAANTACLEHDVRWLRVAFEGRHGLLGPTVVPRQTACFTCYTSRRASHSPPGEFEAYRTTLVRDGEPHPGAAGALTDIVAAQTALEVARLLTAFAPPATFGRFHTFEAGSPRVQSHDVLRVPRCSACGRNQSPKDPWDRSSRMVAE
jgi:bacteriocin biosynthesis cyclodehydratase domain-containing protein